jgi:hypothetical protein
LQLHRLDLDIDIDWVNLIILSDMKKLLLIFMFLILSLNMPSACFKYLIIPSTRSYSEYDVLIKAVVWVESRGDVWALNVKEQSAGPMQIRACRVIEYNRRTGKHYQHYEMFDYDKSREIFLYYARDKSFRQAAKDWNGSGPLTEIYWQKVRKAL